MKKAPRDLETARLQLRMVRESDWTPLAEMFGDEECVRYTIKTPAPAWQAWRWLAGYLGHWELRGYGPYAVVEKSSGEMIGIIGPWFPGDWPEPEIKYSLRRNFWGKGYAPEAVKAVKEMAAKELGWKRVISLIAADNTKSKSVALKNGAVYEKTIPFRDATADIYVYDLSRSSNT